MSKRDLWVDFNEVDERSRVHSLLRYASRGAKIVAGATIVVGDDEGNRCRAEVIAVDGSSVELAIDGNTFQHPDASASPSLISA